MMSISSQDDEQEVEDGEQIGELNEDGGDRRKHDSRGKLVNYYFTNFPNDCNQANLRDLFTKAGEVIDVYVARKVSKEGKRFGFARFSNVKNSLDLENRLNHIWIRKFNLKVNIAKYEKPAINGNQRTFIRIPSPKEKDGCNSVEVKVDGKILKFELPTSVADHEIVIRFMKVNEPGKNRNKAHDQDDVLVNEVGGVKVNGIKDSGRKRPKELDTKEGIVIDGGDIGITKRKVDHKGMVESLDAIENGGVKVNGDESDSATDLVKSKAATQFESVSVEPVIPLVIIGKHDRITHDVGINKGDFVGGGDTKTNDVDFNVTKTSHAWTSDVPDNLESNLQVDAPHFENQTDIKFGVTMDGPELSCGLNLVDKGKPKSATFAKKKTCKIKKKMN